ncbi:MAG: class I SAM-dependent methyltransferase [Halalkalicoccus sp.]
MESTLYDHPGVYDALYAGKEYDAEVAFMLDRASDPDRALVVGCGTGEHARRLYEAGLDVVGVDPSPAMVGRARTKSDAEFCVGTLPKLPVAADFDLVAAPFTVLNYLSSAELVPALADLAARVADDGVLILDTGDFPEMTAPALQIAVGPDGDCARLFQFHRESGRSARMDALVFHDTSWFVDRHTLTTFTDEEVRTALAELGFTVERRDWYTDRTIMPDPSVFVAHR